MMEQGYKYLANGQKVWFKGMVDKEYLVSPVYVNEYDYDYDDDEEYISDQVQTVSRIFDKPPKPVFEAAISRLKEEIKELKEESGKARNEMYEARKEMAQFEKSYGANPYFKVLRAILEKKVTHYVYPREPGIKKIRYDEESLDVLVLHRRGKELKWHLKEDYENIGEIIPCQSEDEAIEHLTAIVSSKLDSITRYNRPHQARLIEAAKKYGIPYLEAEEAMKKDEAKSVQDTIDRLKNDLEEYTAKLDSLMQAI